MSPRTGRPPSENPRHYVLRTRLSDDEREAVERAAEASDEKPATWAREQLVRAAKRANRKATD